MKKKLTRYKIPVTYQCCGTLYVESDTLENAVQTVLDNRFDMDPPENSEYVEGSMDLTYTDLTFLKTIQ